MVNPKSIVYTATYSGIQVFEMSIGDCTMMRRRSDSYLNATQILKLGGLDKGKRTKVLEREVITKTHEKIQGGYGKYQGTWVPLEIGRELAERYQVLDFLLPLVDFNPSTWDELPEKEQMPTRTSRTRINHGHSSQPQTSPPSSPSYSSQQNTLTPSDSHKRKPTPFENDENGSSNATATPTPLPLPSPSSATTNTKKKSRIQVQPKQQTNDTGSGSNNSNTPLASPARPTIISKKDYGMDTDMERNRNILLSIFSSNEEDLIPSYFYGTGALAGIDWDISIDDHGHTALHWSASLGRMHTVEWLIAKGANVIMVNSAGETPLMRGVMTTSIYDHDCFAHMLDILRDSLSLVDYSGRTVLHHIILSTLESKITANLGVIQSPSPSSLNTRMSTAPSMLTNSLSLSAPAPPAPPASSSASTQHENRLLAAKSYMVHALKVIGQHNEHLHILNQPDNIGETPYFLACRLNCSDLCYLMEQSGCSLLADDAQPRNGVSSFLALPPPVPEKQTEQPSKRTRKKVEKKQDKKDPPVDDLANTASMKGQELVSTVQRIVHSMDVEFSSKLQAKEADILRMQQEIKDLTRQLDDLHRQQSETRKIDTGQLEQAYSKIKHLEDILGKSGIKYLEVRTTDATNNKKIQLLSTSTATSRENEVMSDREKQLEQQVILLQSQLKESNNNARHTETLVQTHSETLELLASCKRLIAACCNLPLEKVDDFIGPLTMAIENDPPDLNFARVIGFMEKLRQHQQ